MHIPRSLSMDYRSPASKPSALLAKKNSTATPPAAAAAAAGEESKQPETDSSSFQKDSLKVVKDPSSLRTSSLPRPGKLEPPAEDAAHASSSLPWGTKITAAEGTDTNGKSPTAGDSKTGVCSGIHTHTHTFCTHIVYRVYRWLKLDFFFATQRRELRCVRACPAAKVPPPRAHRPQEPGEEEEEGRREEEEEKKGRSSTENPVQSPISAQILIGV